MDQINLKRGVLIVALAVTVIAAGFIYLNSGQESSLFGPVPIEEPVETHNFGGTVNIAVSSPPELSDQSIGGDTLRQLVLPSLFIAQPDGSWRASLVEPGSDRSSSDFTYAQFKLRANAQWSDGSAITVDDLRRSADKRFVSSIEGGGPDKSGYITVKFENPLPGWRRLWSGNQSISPVKPDLFAGPYRIESVTSGLETVVVRNEKWWGKPFIDQIRLILVAENAIGRELLSNGLVDIFSPPADTVRSVQLSQIQGIKISSDQRSGQWSALRMNPDKINKSDRKAILTVFPRKEFVGALLEGEADLLDSLSGNQPIWNELKVSSENKLENTQLIFSISTQEPLGQLLGRSLQRGVSSFGGTLLPRFGDESQVQKWIKESNYDLVLETQNDGPEVCWLCHFDFEKNLAIKADAGDKNAVQQLEQTLRDEWLYLPLWKAKPAVAWRSGTVEGIRANGYANGVAWNAYRWWKP